MDNTQFSRGAISATASRILRVLVIDGELAHRKLLCALVGQAGDEAIEAADGREGLDKARTLRPDAVIVSCRTPIIPGVEMVRCLRQDLGARPYLILSVGPDAEDELAAGVAYGADDWITKPIRQELALARLQLARRILLLQSDQDRQSSKLRQYADELTRLHGRIRRLALTDDLTGLPNRRFARRQLQKLWSHASPLACLVVDLDGFKRLVHSYGREASNEVLRSVAAALTDGTSPEDVVCRLGGDSFLVVLPGQPLVRAMAVAESLLARVEGLGIQVDGSRLGISIGAAERCPQVGNPAELLRLAEQGMHLAKFNGRNRVMSGHSGPPSLELGLWDPIPGGPGPALRAGK